MDTVALCWRDHRQMLEEVGASESVIAYCQWAFDAGADMYLIPGYTVDELWKHFRELMQEGKKKPQWLIEDCEQAFKAGAEAQWMVTATTDELRAYMNSLKEQLRREVQ